MENTTLTEIITIYERMHKGRASDTVFRVSKFGLPTTIEVDNQIVEETISIVPSFHHPTPEPDNAMRNPGPGPGSSNGELPTKVAVGRQWSGASSGGDSSSSLCSRVTALQQLHQAPDYEPYKEQQYQQSNIIDFNKFKFLRPKKYIFFSKCTNLIQSDDLSGLSDDYVELLKSKSYWLNITNPAESDLSILFTSFNVHDLTISDIREKDTEEKIEIFKHYTFISMRLMCESIKERAEDMDFNILLFKDFVITIHDKQWASIKDILGFLNLLTVHSPLTPDWVLFSVFIELAQDAQFLVEGMQPEINQIRIGSKSLDQMSDVMRRIFDMEFQIYTIGRFLKPKMNILRTLKTKCGKRLSKIVVRLISDIRDDFKEISYDLKTLDHVLERSQDTFLALVNVEKSREANEMSKVMKRISEIALVFLPIQAIAGFLGMNVQVPYQQEQTTFYFWCIVAGSISLAAFAYFLRTYIFRKQQWSCCGRRKPKQDDISIDTYGFSSKFSHLYE